MSNKAILNTALITSIVLFVASLTQECYHTTGSDADSLAVLLMGGLGLITEIAALSSGHIDNVGATFTWLANPLLLMAWILSKSRPKVSIILNSLACLLSLSFLLFKSVIGHEAGHYDEIINYQLGYWLWVLSITTMLVGSIWVYFRKNHSENS